MKRLEVLRAILPVRENSIDSYTHGTDILESIRVVHLALTNHIRSRIDFIFMLPPILLVRYRHISGPS
jgi:hypothetical protein